MTGKTDASGSGRRFALVVSRFNEFVTAKLRDGAREALLARGVDQRDILELWVPGAFEIPLVAQEIARTSRFDAIICLGAVIRGETPHFDYIAAECARGVAEVGRTSGIPVVFGVLTTETVEQARARAGGKLGNKGWDAANAAIDTVSLLASVREK
jgi:6,7-dimethyl-8-ribityllumazine synthase